MKVDTPKGIKHITLENVGLVHGFLTSIVSMQLLNERGLHWSSRAPTKLEFEDGSLACTLFQSGRHILFNNPDKFRPNTTLMARLTYDPKLRTLTEAKLHRIIAHASSDVISHINGPCYGINIDRLEPSPKTVKCTTCSLAKSKNIISRRTGSETPRSRKPFHTLFWDAIVMEEAYNSEKYVSHFYCPDSHFNFVFTCRSKREFKLTIRTVIQIINTQWEAKVKIIRLDGETSLIEECRNLTTEQGIICQTSSPNTPEQNGSAERSGGVLFIKARAMILEASLPTNLWPEVVGCAAYIANRTPIRQLGWKTPFEIVNNSKPSYAHLREYGCRAYALNKSIPHSKKLDSRAHLGHLIGYDSTNIFKIWIPSKNKVIRTRDVTFDEEKFYDPGDLDLGAVLPESAEKLLQIIDIPEADDEEIQFENNDSIINYIPTNPENITNIPSHDSKDSITKVEE